MLIIFCDPGNAYRIFIFMYLFKSTQMCKRKCSTSNGDKTEKSAARQTTVTKAASAHKKFHK